MEQGSYVVALAGLVATLAGAIVWVVKQVLGTTLPQMQASQEKQLAQLCQWFREEAERDRAATREFHAQISQRLAELTVSLERNQEALAENQTTLQVLLQRHEQP